MSTTYCGAGTDFDNTADVLRCYDGELYNPVTETCDATGATLPGALQSLAVVGPKTGQLTAVGNAVSATYFTAFDSLYQTKSSTQYTGSNRYDLAYGYNVAGGLTSETYPSGRSISYTYDPAGRIGSASGTKDSTTTLYASQFSYAPHGAVASLKLGNNIVESTTFNSRLQPQTIAAGGLMTLTFGYGTTDNNGNVRQQTISRPGVLTATQHYRYDGVNRLAIAAENAEPAAGDGCPAGAVWCRDYTYDNFGNRAIIDAPGAPASQFAPTALSQFSALTNQIASVPGAANPAYDAVGNLVSHAGVGVNLAYDANNKMTSFTGTSPTLQQQGGYDYDGDGRRVQRQSTIAGTSITPTYVYDAFGNLAAEYSTQATETPDTYYRTTDHLGSTRLVTRANGTVKKCLDFLPFGEPLDDGIANRNQSCYGDSDEGPFKQKFTGKERDDESGLDYSDFRYLSSSLGRFMTPDPERFGAQVADPQSWNGYPYAGNNPLRFIDPLGLDYYEVCGVDGNDCVSYSQKLYDRLRKDDSVIVAGGDIYARNENGTQGLLIGSVTFVATGMDDRGDEISGGLAARADASKQFIAAFAASAVVVGATGGAAANLSGITSGSGLTSIGTIEVGAGSAEAGSGAFTILNPHVPPKTLGDLVQAAQKLYPNKASLVEQHHIFPKHLGGPASGPTVPLNGSYHQVITNSFRQAWGYGQGPPAPGVAQQIMQRVYNLLPYK